MAATVDTFIGCCSGGIVAPGVRKNGRGRVPPGDCRASGATVAARVHADDVAIISSPEVNVAGRYPCRPAATGDEYAGHFAMPLRAPKLRSADAGGGGRFGVLFEVPAHHGARRRGREVAAGVFQQGYQVIAGRADYCVLIVQQGAFIAVQQEVIDMVIAQHQGGGKRRKCGENFFPDAVKLASRVCADGLFAACRNVPVNQQVCFGHGQFDVIYRQVDGGGGGVLMEVAQHADSPARYSAVSSCPRASSREKVSSPRSSSSKNPLSISTA